jgi:hypothetical protein
VHKHTINSNIEQEQYIAAKMVINAKSSYDNNNITKISHVNDETSKGFCTEDALNMTGATVTSSIRTASA